MGRGRRAVGRERETERERERRGLALCVYVRARFGHLFVLNVLLFFLPLSLSSFHASGRFCALSLSLFSLSLRRHPVSLSLFSLRSVGRLICRLAGRPALSPLSGRSRSRLFRCVLPPAHNNNRLADTGESERASLCVTMSIRHSTTEKRENLGDVRCSSALRHSCETALFFEQVLSRA